MILIALFYSFTFSRRQQTNTYKTNNRKNGFIAALATAAALAVLSTAVVASATTTDNNFIGPSPGDYNTAGNWSLGYVPGTGATSDDAEISGKNVSLSADLSTSASNLASVTVNDGGYLGLGSGGAVATSPTAYQANWMEGWIYVGSSVFGDLATNSGSGSLAVNGGAINAAAMQLGNSSTFTLSSGEVTTQDRSAFLGVDSSGNVTATLSGGTLNADGGGTGGSAGFVVGYSGSATVIQDGATVYAPNGGYASSIIGNSGTGTWKLQSGTLYANSLTLGQNAGSSGTLDVSSGSFNGSVQLIVGNAGNGVLTISGGTFNTPSSLPTGADGGAGFGYGNGVRFVDVGTGSGTGLLQIIGTAATINITRANGGGGSEALLSLGANGTLEFDINAATVSTIALSGPAGLEDTADLAGTINMQLLGGYTPGLHATYNLLTAGTITDTQAGYGLAAGESSDWTLSIIGAAGSGQTLQATYIGQPAIPEPAALGLLGVAGLGILLLGKRRKAV